MSENNYGALMMRGALPANANLNSYGPVPDFIGIWSRPTNTNTTAAYNFPEDSGQGILEVMAGGLQGGTQRYTTGGGNVYTRSLTAVWNGTDGPWGPWLSVGYQVVPTYADNLDTMMTAGAFPCRSTTTNKPPLITQGGWVFITGHVAAGNVLQIYHTATALAGQQDRRFTRTYNGASWTPWKIMGTDALNDLGLGLSASKRINSFDWQQADFLTGSMQTFVFSSSLNPPSGVSYNNNTTVTATTIQRNSNASVIKLNSLSTANGDRGEFIIVVTGAAGSRSFNAIRSYNSDSSTVIPIDNGGTGAATAAGGLANLNGAPLESPTLTGTPKAPTAAQTDNSTQIATTAFVRAAIAAVLNGSPAALDTLKELADALGNDANFSTTVLNALAGKQPLNAILTSLSGAVTAADRLPYFNDVNKVAVPSMRVSNDCVALTRIPFVAVPLTVFCVRSYLMPAHTAGKTLPGNIGA